MTTLAESFRRNERVYVPNDKHLTGLHAGLRVMLSTEKPKMVTRSIIENIRRTRAEEFVFDEDPVAVVTSHLHHGSLQPETFFLGSRLVTSPMWVEWSLPKSDGRFGDDWNTGFTRLGVAYAYEHERTHMIFVTEFDGPTGQPVGPGCPVRCGQPFVFGWLSVDGELPTDQGSHFNSHVWLGEDNTRVTEWFMDALVPLFVLSTPRVAEVSAPSISRQVRRQMERDIAAGRDVPSIEFRRVTMHLTERKAAQSSAPTGETSGVSGGQRKLHQVIGHFRTFTKKRDTPHVVFVPEHWRGDANKGIIIHERHVGR